MNRLVGRLGARYNTIVRELDEGMANRVAGGAPTNGYTHCKL